MTKYPSQKYIAKVKKPCKDNPWSSALATSIKTKNSSAGVVSKTVSMVNKTTGEVQDETLYVGMKKTLDAEEFVKVFHAGIASMFNLNKSSQDLFSVILHIYASQKFEPEQVYINDTVLLDFNYDRSAQVRRQALNQLINKEFLAEVEGMPHKYWVNPNLFYKGNRMTLIHDYAVKGTEEGLQMEKEIATSGQRELPI